MVKIRLRRPFLRYFLQCTLQLPHSSPRAFDLNFLSQLAVRVARDERQETVQRHGEITPGAALCIAVECAAVISEPGLFDC